MSFTGKATYTAGLSLPELCEDVSDIIGIVSPYETPLLDILGDPGREAVSIYHEWLEDSLLTNKSEIVDSDISNPSATTIFDVDDGGKFRVGDQLQIDGSSELMLVQMITGSTLSVVRGYAGTTPEAIATGSVINILGNAAIEGSERESVRFTNRRRCGNFTQILTAAVEVSGSDIASRQHGLADEMDYQKQERLRELLRDLENIVINGGQAVSNPQGSSTVRRTMKGIVQHISTNGLHVGDSGLPTGNVLTEEILNCVLRRIWENSNSGIDTIVVNGYQKRQLNNMLNGARVYQPQGRTVSSLVSYYESDYGLCRVVLCRWLPKDMVLFLDSGRVSVLPLAGRSFHFKPLASTGDYESGQLIGEYTLELKNEEAHGYLRGLSIG
ncbi:MAG: DUF5309 family protein [Sedimentisphaerales bacterium]|nr:DUF5309 family protein [Sedimentisphaerales bacterium]MBN2843338.1 DUF5309 family protein [Sedimentisphaerales bacterium]